MAILYCWSGAAGSGSGADWANAKTTLTAAFSTELAGDTIYVAHDHAETSASAINLVSSGTAALTTKVVCVNRAGSVPPVSADRRATAQVTTTGTAAIQISSGVCFTHYDGIIFNCGTGASAANLQVVGGTGSGLVLENCSLRLNTTAAATITFGTTAVTQATELRNTTMSFGAATQTVIVFGIVRWRNTPAALLGTIPTTLISNTNQRGAILECIGVDFSALGSGKTLLSATTTMGHSYRFIDCKLDAAVTKMSIGSSLVGGFEVDFVRCGAAGVNYTVHRQRMEGLLTEEATIYRTGGAAG